MKKISITVAAFTLVVSAAVVACNSGSTSSGKTEGLSSAPAEVKGVTEAQSQEALIKRGNYLVTIMGCNDCHSPKVMTAHGPDTDTAQMLGGHPAAMPVARVNTAALKDWVMFNQSLTAFVGPWGVSFAANITSDETGIGNWTEAQFFKAIREGKYKGMDNTRPMLPPMPWNMYRNASDEDLRAIFAYLKSTPPVENRVPAPIPPDQLSKLQ